MSGYFYCLSFNVFACWWGTDYDVRAKLSRLYDIDNEENQ